MKPDLPYRQRSDRLSIGVILLLASGLASRAVTTDPAGVVHDDRSYAIGRVVTSDGPLADAKVEVWAVRDDGGAVRFSGRTVEDGSFEIELLLDWSWIEDSTIHWLQRISRTGFVSRQGPPHRVEGPAGDAPTYRLEPASHGAVRGQVMSERSPVDGAVVQCVNTRGEVVAETKTNALGYYELTPGIYDQFYLSASKEGVGKARTDSMRVRMKLTRRVQPMVLREQITGTLQTPRGSPVYGLELSLIATDLIDGLTWKDERLPPWHEPPTGSTEERGVIYATVHTQTNGSFYFGGLGSGRFVVAVTDAEALERPRWEVSSGGHLDKTIRDHQIRVELDRRPGTEKRTVLAHELQCVEVPTESPPTQTWPVAPNTRKLRPREGGFDIRVKPDTEYRIGLGSIASLEATPLAASPVAIRTASNRDRIETTLEIDRGEPDASLVMTTTLEPIFVGVSVEFAVTELETGRLVTQEVSNAFIPHATDVRPGVYRIYARPSVVDQITVFRTRVDDDGVDPAADLREAVNAALEGHSWQEPTSLEAGFLAPTSIDIGVAPGKDTQVHVEFPLGGRILVRLRSAGQPPRPVLTARGQVEKEGVTSDLLFRRLFVNPTGLLPQHDDYYFLSDQSLLPGDYTLHWVDPFDNTHSVEVEIQREEVSTLDWIHVKPNRDTKDR